MRGGAALAAAALLAAAPALAQDGWEFAATPYAWVPGFTNKVQTKQGWVEVDKSSSDALSDLDMAFMGTFEARNGRWGLLLDLIYTDLGASSATPLGRLWDKADMTTRMTAFSVYAGYRVFENEKSFVDVLAGGRFYTLDIDLSLKPGQARGRDFDLSADWADPLIGLRGHYAFTDKWFVTAAGDAGGFDGGSDNSWQALGAVGYQFAERWSAQAGWRYMAIEKKIGGRKVEVDLSGPLVGVTYRF